MISITHARAASTVGPANPALLGGPDWNANHVITGLAASASTDTTNASNITSGTLPLAQMPTVYLESAGGGVNSTATQNTNALQSLAAAGYVRVLLGPGTYNFNPVSALPNNYTIIEGSGEGVTTLSWTTGTLLTFQGMYERSYGCGLKNVTLYSPDTANQKIGLLTIDQSGFLFQNVTIQGAGTNSILTGGAGGSVGLMTMGREYFRGEGRGSIRADRPVVIGKNPNSYISADLFLIDRNIDLVGGTAYPVVIVMPGVMLSNTTLRADMQLGTHGFYWNDTSTYNNVQTVNAAGTGYAPGDTINIAGGLASASAVVRVLTVNGSGGVTAAAVVSCGTYSVNPTFPASQSSTSGSGTGATFTLNDVVSENLTIGGRTEQGTSLSSNSIYIAPYSRIDVVRIDGFTFESARKGVYLRNTRGATLLTPVFIPGGGATEAVNADATNEALMIINAEFLTGTTTSISGLTQVLASAIPTGYAFPAFALYSTAGGMNFGGAVVSSSNSGGVGYATGAGGAITQVTSKGTAVTLNAMSGQVTMNGASLASSAIASLRVNNSSVSATDIITVNVVGGFATPGSYLAWVEENANGSFIINVRNMTAGALSEAVVIGFAVIKGATS